ncbi:L,D-transpeptidase [Rhizobium sp. LjRoot30]|uniref:L,D-transpeptidase n=1 Tax=Rhizobium sp. LjRoot30 TaxID=3342320 RepID=UPI003ECD581E
MKKFIAAVMACLFFQFQPVVAQAANLVANVDITRQTMTVSQNGIVRYRWKVSTGRSGFGTPTGNYKAKWLSKNHRSRKYNNAPMPYAVFFKGGYAIHGTNETKRLGRPASHGCVRLDPRNAAQFFAMASTAGLGNTRIVISH